MSGRIREKMNGKECKCDVQTNVEGITAICYTFFEKILFSEKVILVCFSIRISHPFFDLKLLNHLKLLNQDMTTFIKKMPTFSVLINYLIAHLKFLFFVD